MSVAAMGIAALAAGCGDNFQNRDCATGTKPDPSGVNQCVPDGSVICGQGTVFNMTSGKCDPSADECPDGTILVNNECVTSATPDAEEAAEPNDATSAGSIDLPDIGKPGFVIHGCITPRDAGATADNDPWFVTVDKPTLLEITADGIGGLAAGYVVQPASDTLAALNANSWARFGINLTGDTSSRQVYLPAAGTYAVVMADSRQLFLQEAVAGSDKTCYFTTVKQLAVPTPTPLTAGKQTGTIGGDVKLFSVTPTDGELFFTSLTTSSAAANPALVVQVGGTYLKSNEADSTATPVAAGLRFGGTQASAPIVFAVDTTYNYAQVPVDFTFSPTTKAAAALPTAGGNVSTTQGDGKLDTFDDLAFFYFDAQAGDLIHLDVGFDDDANFMIMNPALDLTGFTGTTNVVSGFFGGGLDDTSLQTTAFTGWYRFKTAGRYYVAAFDPDLAAGATFKTTVTLTKATTAPIAVGTPISNHALGTLDAEWFTFDPSAQTWTNTTAGGTGFTGKVAVAYYNSTGEGLVDVDLPTTYEQSFAAAGNQSHGRISFGDPTTYVVRVSDDSGTAAAGATFNLSVAAQTFTNVGEVTEAKPASKPGEDLGGTGKTKLYFVRGHQGDTLTIKVHPTAGTYNASIARLDINGVATTTVDDGGAGADEAMKINVSSLGWVAVAVSGNGATTSYDLSVTAVAPISYTRQPGNLAYADVCNGGANVVAMTDNDEGLSDPITMPWAFNLFGDNVTDFTISTNGFLSFDTLVKAHFGNVAIPTEGEPDGFIAPFWSDLANVEVCMSQDAEKVVIQWTGVGYADNLAVQTQAVMHKSGAIDFIYGSGQVGDGSAATVGFENVFGTYGTQVEFNTAASVKPSTSNTFTPVP